MRQCIECLNGYMHIKKNNINNICFLTNLLLIYLSHKANIIPMQNAGHLFPAVFLSTLLFFAIKTKRNSFEFLL